MMIKQQGTFDCALASISMALGHDVYNWPEAFRAKVEAKQGAYGEMFEEAFQFFGLTYGVDVKSFYTGNMDRHQVAAVLWGRKAMIQVPSLNIDRAQHIVFWDGTEVQDPSNLQVYRWLGQITACEHVWMFNDA